MDHRQARKRLIIGLTGRMGSGKNAVASILAERGFAVIDVDKLGHALLDKEKVHDQLIVTFGPGLLEKGKISRQKLAGIVFSDKAKLKQLNQILHPLMKKLIAKKLRTVHKDFVINAAVLFEIGLEELADVIWVVDASDDNIIKRLRARGVPDNEALRRLSVQMSREEYRCKADKVIDNDFPLVELGAQVVSLLG